jgi:hypothetical protein
MVDGITVQGYLPHHTLLVYSPSSSSAHRLQSSGVALWVNPLPRHAKVGTDWLRQMMLIHAASSSIQTQSPGTSRKILVPSTQRIFFCYIFQRYEY